MMESIKEVEHFFLEDVLPRLKVEAAKGRWENISSENFVVSHFGDGTEQSISLGLVYHVKDVWKIYIGACAVYTEENGNYLAFEYFPVFDEVLEPNIRKNLNDLNADFISILPSEIQEYGWIGLGDGEHYIQIEIFSIEEVFDTLRNLLDEILPRFTKFNFQLPIPPSELTEEMASIQESLEDKFGTFQVIAQEEIINEKLRKGCFLTN